MLISGDLKDLKKSSITIKEGCKYKLKIQFRVQREIVSGLRYFQATHRKGFKVRFSDIQFMQQLVKYGVQLNVCTT